eukprot:577966-Rhodomonas_salina.1
MLLWAKINVGRRSVHHCSLSSSFNADSRFLFDCCVQRLHAMSKRPREPGKAKAPHLVCGPCNKKKSGCNGGWPCEKCVFDNIERWHKPNACTDCTFPMSPEDGRRTLAILQDFQKSQMEDAFKKILEQIKSEHAENCAANQVVASALLAHKKLLNESQLRTFLGNDGFTLGERMHAGGQGVVWNVTHRTTGAIRLAIKVQKNHGSFQGTFERELLALQLCNGLKGVIQLAPPLGGWSRTGIWDTQHGFIRGLVTEYCEHAPWGRLRKTAAWNEHRVVECMVCLLDTVAGISLSLRILQPKLCT